MEHTRIEPRRARAHRGPFAIIALAAAAAACSSQPGPTETEILGSTEQALGGYNYSDNRAWSTSPPSPVTVSNAPQFVEIGFDDNFVSGLHTTPVSGMTWILNFVRNLRNPAGSGNAATFDNALVRVNFYSNTCYIEGTCGSDNTTDLKESWHAAVVDGHETGSHTHSHLDGAGFTAAQWNAEIDPNVDWLTRPYVANQAPGANSGPGVPNANLEGFRAPFLSYNTTLFSELKNNGFTYDISVEESWQQPADGLSYNWPFTLNNGSPGGTFVGRPTGNVTGLWELGAAPFVRPSGLGRVTGLDYNMYNAGFTYQQALDTLKFTLDQRLAGNRAPFFIGAHTHIYSDAVSFAGTTAQERRNVIQDFITYALTKPQVRFATAKNIITWMRNPVALGGGCTPESDATFCSRLAKNCGSITANDNCGTSRTVSSCGTCTSPQTCGGGGTANVCGTSGDKTEGGTPSGTGTACNTTNETVAKAYDNLMTAGTQGVNWTKWCVTSAPSTGTPISTMYDFSGTTAFAINRYTITTGNDVPGRDPKNWTLQGCQGSCTVGSDTGWTTINTQTNQFAGAARFQTSTYSFTNATAFQQYRVRFTANNGDTGRFQLAEIQMFADGGCTPESNSAFCSRLGKNCGSVTANDNCGTSRTVSSCGTCTSPQTCGGGGTANVCGGGTCTPESNSAFCSRLGKNCGSVTANDNCGTSRTVSSCGTCTSPQTCGGGGAANVCGGGGGTCSPTITNMALAKCNDTFVFTDNKLYRCLSQDTGVNGQASPGCGTVGVRCSQITPSDPAWGTTAWLFLQTCN